MEESDDCSDSDPTGSTDMDMDDLELLTSSISGSPLSQRPNNLNTIDEPNIVAFEKKAISLYHQIPTCIHVHDTLNNNKDLVLEQDELSEGSTADHVFWCLPKSKYDSARLDRVFRKCLEHLNNAAYTYSPTTSDGFMDPILDGLNAAQHAAVTSPSTVLQILAPPGSGKTKTLTSRVAYLLSHYNYKPWNIVCLTFTIKSSREMKERIARLIGNGMEAKLILGTFHSVCRRYLARYGHLIGIRKGFGIADSSDSSGIIKRIIKRLSLNMEPKKAQSRITSSKSRGISHSDLRLKEQKTKSVDQQEFALIFEAYESQLEKSNLLDYDDLLLRCVDLLREYPACVSNVQAVLIDEFQDTNLVQFDLMRLFASMNERVTTVGDPDQSIYGWRSAEVKNLKRMQKQYPDTLVIHLEDNYRSSGAILLAARGVIEQDESRVPRPLLPTHCPGTVPVLRKLPSAEIEALWTISEIKRAVGMTGGLVAYSDFAILLRSASLSRHIESAMGRSGIPYRMVGGQKFFDRIEIKILLDYLRVFSQPNNNDALARIINVPTRGIGVTTVKALLEEAEVKKVSLWTLVRNAVQGHVSTKAKISKPAEQGLSSFINVVLTATQKMADTIDPASPESLLRFVIKKLGFQAYLMKSHENDHEARWANVEELLAQASETCAAVTEDVEIGVDDNLLPHVEGVGQQKATLAEEALSEFLTNVALATDLHREDHAEEEDASSGRVTISTIHAAKGLEWPVVFIPSAYEGSLPHSRAEDTDEERRLLYVAMTRAQALLYLSFPTKNSQREETTLSQFLSTKNVAQYLVHKGPTLDISTVRDISRTLRRDMPDEQHFLEGYKTIQSIDDDLWPLDGKEDPEVVQARWNKRDSATHTASDQYISKRRRIVKDDVDEGLLILQNNTIDKATMVSTSTTTTMHSRVWSSYPTDYGFVSAASYIQHNKQQQERSQPADNTPLRKGFKAVSVKLAVPKLSEVGSNPNVGPRTGDKGSLLSFLTAKPINARAKNNTIVSALEMPWAARKKTIGSKEALKKMLGEPYPMDPTSSLEEKSINSALTAPLINARRRPAEIPPNLASHKLRVIPDSSRPYVAVADEGSASKQYVFLSSSPPPPPDGLEQAEAGSKNESHLSTFSVGQHHNSQSQPRGVDAHPAATFHTTSVIQSHTAQNIHKKTLGVRRSMGGWTNRAHKGFSVPSKPGGMR